MKFIFLIICITFITNAEAQIQYLVSNSDLIIEGAVLKKQSKWNENRTRIITENEILVKSVFKGVLSDSLITVITPGGIMSDLFQFQTHAIELSLKEKGYFFLTKKDETIFTFIDVNKGFAIENSDLNPKVFIDGQKFLKKQFEEKIIKETLFPKFSIQEVLDFKETELFNKNNLCDTLPPSKNLKTIEFTFENVQYTDNLTHLEFDIIAKVNTPGLKFGRADLFVNYSSEFGENIISNQLAEITKGTILQGDLYSLSYQDVTSNKVKILSDSDVGVNSLFTFSESGESIVHLKLSIEDFNQIGSISFDDIDITGDVYYWCNGSYQLFDEVILDKPITNTNAKPNTEIGITYTLENPSTNSSETEFSVDVFVEATESSFFADGFIYWSHF